MGRTPTLIVGLVVFASLAGCGEEVKTSKADAQKDLLAPTDVNSLSPEMKARVSAIEKGNAAAAKKAGGP